MAHKYARSRSVMFTMSETRISYIFFAHSGIDAGVKIRPTPEELEAWGPEFRKRWESYFAPAPDKPVLWMGPASM